MKLSILIPTIKRHRTLFDTLLVELQKQTIPYNGTIEILIDDAENDKIGVKRNRLLDKAIGEYVAFIDSDDEVGFTYIEHLMKAIHSGIDCASLLGRYSVDGNYDGLFEHSLKYDKWETSNGEIKYLRFPNHLNCIKSSIAKQFKFPENNFGEDFDWSKQIHESGLLKTEYYINEILYYYNFISKK